MQQSSERVGLWRHAEFQKLWAAQAVSLAGSQVTLLALPLTATLTLQASAAEMGVLQALNLVPVLVVGLAAGVWVDRMRRRPVLIAADFGRAALLATIPLSAYLGLLRIEQLYVVALLAGALTVFFDVAHVSLLPSLVPREQLSDGNSKLEVSRSVAIIVGPGATGLLVQVVTAPIAIALDAVSFVVSAALLMVIRTPETAPQPREHGAGGFWSELAEGLRVVAREPSLRTMALSLGAYNLFAQWVAAVYVLYAIRELNLAPATLGLIFTVGGLTFPISALFAGRVAARVGLGPAITWGAGICDAAFLLIPVAIVWPVAAVPILMAAQLIATLTGPITSINQLSLRQAITPDQLRGRVNGSFRFLALGAGPLGAIVGGLLGGMLGLWPAILLGTLGIQLGFVVFLVSPLRPLKELPGC
jgi:MFS family permease